MHFLTLYAGFELRRVLVHFYKMASTMSKDRGSMLEGIAFTAQIPASSPGIGITPLFGVEILPRREAPPTASNIPEPIPGIPSTVNKETPNEIPVAVIFEHAGEQASQLVAVLEDWPRVRKSRCNTAPEDDTYRCFAWKIQTPKLVDASHKVFPHAEYWQVSDV